ncbi:MAG TPA: hypothetical protein VF881_10380 [Polyangiaceae bacterium]
MTMTRLHISSLVVIGAVTTLLTSRAPAAESDLAPVAPSKDYACGDKGKPPCPMQAWMKANMAPAAANGDPDALAKALDYVSSHSPPGFTEWSKIAKGGADAARKKDVDAAKKSCKTCHDQYKAKYKEEMRDRAF